MEALRDLTYLLNRYAIRDIDIISNPERKKSKDDLRYWDFYEGVQKNKWKTEDEIAKAFKYDSKGDKGYRRLREGFKERALTTLLFIDLDPNVYSEYEIKAAELAKLTTITLTLRRRGSRELFHEVAQKALNLALEVDNTIMTLQLVSIMTNFYTISPVYIKKFNHLNRLLSKYSELAYLETQAQVDFTLFVSEVSIKKGYKKEFADKVRRMYEKYIDKLNSNHSFMFQAYARQLGLGEKLLRHKWEDAMNYCDESLEVFKIYGPRAHENTGMFVSQKAGCLIMLGRYSDAIDTLENYLNLIQFGSTKWYKNREITSIACFYEKNYDKAWGIVQSAIAGDRFNSISEYAQETWRLYEGYLHLIVRVPGSNLHIENGQQYRLSRLLNDMPIYAQDKRGGNIPLLILQVLFLLSELGTNKNALEEIQNRLEALRKYTSRNLDPNEEHVRTSLFIQLLLLLPKHVHKPTDLHKAAHDLLQKMQGHENELLDTSFETEVVPYERQWEWVMGFVEAAQGK